MDIGTLVGIIVLAKSAFYVGSVVAIVVVIRRAIARAGAAGSPIGPGAALGSDFMSQITALHALIQEANKARSMGGFVPANTASQFQSQLMKAQREMQQMDLLSRQRHDTFVSGMLGDATAAGLDVSGWNIR